MTRAVAIERDIFHPPKRREGTLITKGLAVNPDYVEFQPRAFRFAELITFSCELLD